VREKLLERTHAELPHTSTVILESYDQAADAVRIGCRILVERQSQKGIVIGRGGAMIKAIGSAARQELMTMLGCEVHLVVDVAVRRQWREDARLLDRLGLMSG